MAKLYNTIIVFDVYSYANSPEEARAAVLACIRDAEQPEPTSEETALEVRKENEIRAVWHEKGPIVGESISDEDFGKVKGKTTLDVYAMLHKKSVAPSKAVTANGQKATATK